MAEKFRKWLHRLNSSEQGQTLILALIVMILTSFLIGPLLNHMTTGMRNSREVYTRRTEEQYAADAGVSQAMWYIKYQNDDIPEYFALGSVNNKPVFVNITWESAEDETVTYTIESRAGSTTTTAVIGYVPEVEAVPEVPGTDAVSYFVNAVATNSGNITLSGAAKIYSDSGKNGDVISGGGVSLSGSSMIEGDVYATSNVTLAYSTKIDGNAKATGTVGTSGTVTGARTSSAPAQTAPEINGAKLDTMVQAVYDETYNAGTLTPGGTVVNGDMTVANQSGTHYGQLWVKGNLIFQNVNTNVVFDSQVYVNGNIYFKSGTQGLTFTCPVYAGGQMYVGSGSGTITFNNAIIAASMNLTGAYSFIFRDKVKSLGDFSVGNSVSTTFNNTVYAGGNFTYSGAANLSISHDIYIKGNLVMGNSTQIIGPQKVVIRGNVTLSGATMLSSAQLPFVIMPPASTTPVLASGVNPSTFTLANSAIASGVVYAPTADFSASGAVKLCGGIICKSATISNSAMVEYLVGLAGRSDLGSPGTPGTPAVPGSPESWGLNNWDIQ